MEYVIFHNTNYITTRQKSKEQLDNDIPSIPYKLWEYYCKEIKTPRRLPLNEQFLYTLMTPAKASISSIQPGITFEGLHYISSLEEIERIRYELQHKRKKIDVRYDPRDVSRIYYLDRNNTLHTFILNLRIPENSSFQGMTWDYYRSLRKKSKEMDSQKGRYITQNRIFLKESVSDIVIEAKSNKGIAETNTTGMTQARRQEKEFVSNANNFGDKIQMPTLSDDFVKEHQKYMTDTNKDNIINDTRTFDTSFIDVLENKDQREVAYAALNYMYDD